MKLFVSLALGDVSFWSSLKESKQKGENGYLGNGGIIMKILVFCIFIILSLAHCGGNTFTITNKTSGEEEVFIYYKKGAAVEKFVLKPSSCIVVRPKEFEGIAVKVTRGGFGFGEKTLCGGGEVSNCLPENYEVINAGEYVDEYRLIPVKEEQEQQSCSLLLE